MARSRRYPTPLNYPAALLVMKDGPNETTPNDSEIDLWVDKVLSKLTHGGQDDYGPLLQEVPSGIRDAVQTRVLDRASRHKESTETGPSEVSQLGDLDFSVVAEATPDEPPTRTIGHYKVLQQIGEGGMGTVYMAEQQEPVSRRVALKIIKLGMDTREVIARFEAERQALAMMDHPNIAKVLDVGTTDGGRPFFAMELVKGLPITRYCDDRKLSLAKRLQLFRSVCHGVQHAHQRGVIHRDLKPSNILVAEYDHQAVPKIIDFGLAKAMHQPLTDRTVFTRLGQVVGTWTYMSPEQSKMNQLEIDTRSDIYSLGVILYEILTGTTPFERNELQAKSIDQILEIIREKDPPLPSQRVSTAGSSPKIAANRQTDPGRLHSFLNGELDWIVMKAIDKERSRRYDSAKHLADDIDRYLTGNPVQAAPQSTTYRLQKFVRRNRTMVASTAIVLVTLIGGIVGTTLGLIQANRARIDAETARAKAESRRQTTRDALDLMSGTMLDDWLLAQTDITEDHRQFLQKVLAYYEEFAEDSGDDFDSRMEVVKAYQRVGDINNALGQTQAALDAFMESARILEQMEPDDRNTTRYLQSRADIFQRIGQLHTRTGNRTAGKSFYDQASQIFARLVAGDPDSFEHLHRQLNLQYLIARLLIADRQREQAMPILDDVIRKWKAIGQNSTNAYLIDFSVSRALQTQALQLRYSGQETQAIAAYQEAIDILNRLIRLDPLDRKVRWQLSVAINDLGILHKAQKRYETAEKLYRQSLELRKSLYGENPNDTEYATLLGGSYLNLGNLSRILGRHESAMTYYRNGITICQRVLDRDPADVLPRKFIRNMHEGLAESQILAGDFEASLTSWERAIANNAPKYSINDPDFSIRLPLRKAYVLARLNRVDSAVRLTENILDGVEENNQGEAWYCGACVYSALSQTGSDPERQEQFARKAVDLLKKSIEIGEAWSGPKGTDWKSDQELDALRQRSDFPERDSAEKAEANSPK